MDVLSDQAHPWYDRLHDGSVFRCVVKQTLAHACPVRDVTGQDQLGHLFQDASGPVRMVQRPIAVGLLADLTQRAQLAVDSQRLTVERDTLILCPVIAEGRSVSSAGLIDDLPCDRATHHPLCTLMISGSILMAASTLRL